MAVFETPVPKRGARSVRESGHRGSQATAWGAGDLLALATLPVGPGRPAERANGPGRGVGPAPIARRPRRVGGSTYARQAVSLMAFVRRLTKYAGGDATA